MLMSTENLARASTRLGVELSVQMTAESILLSFSDDIAPTLPLISGDWEAVQLACLQDIYRVHDAVTEFRMTLTEAIDVLAELAERKSQYSAAFTVFTYALTCTCIGPLMFNASILDLPPTFCLGFFLGILRVYSTAKSRHRDVIDVLMVVLTSCLARLLGTISNNQICFPALAQSIIAILIPGYTFGEFEAVRSGYQISLNYSSVRILAAHVDQ